MVKIKAFDKNAKAYDAWFEEHEGYYQLELEAVRQLMPKAGRGVEIGVGTGHFAKPLGIEIGVEPSSAMRKIAIENGIRALDGVAESLPLESKAFDYALFVTTICFLDSLEKSFSEVNRILKTGGYIVIGFIKKESDLARKYESRKGTSKFYKDATFHEVEEVVAALKANGFVDFQFVQTLLTEADEPQVLPAVKPGYEEGAFIVVRAKKK